MKTNVNENAASQKNSPQKSKFEQWMDNDYAPCTKLVIESIRDKGRMPTAGRVTIGIVSFICAPFVDPVVWIKNKIGFSDD